MDKEKEPINSDSFSEKKLDLAMDKSGLNDQVKGGNIFDPKKPKNQINSGH